MTKKQKVSYLTGFEKPYRLDADANLFWNEYGELGLKLMAAFLLGKRTWA